MPLKHNLMTTLHGLVTISEPVFAGFNLINTGDVNWLIMCQTALKMHHSEAKNPNIFWGGGTAIIEGTGDTPPQTTPHRRLRRVDTRAFGVDLPQTKVLDPPVAIVVIGE